MGWFGIIIACIVAIIIYQKLKEHKQKMTKQYMRKNYRNLTKSERIFRLQKEIKKLKEESNPLYKNYLSSLNKQLEELER